MERVPQENNFTKVKPSRKKLRAGDVFAMHFEWLDGYVLGRVIWPKAQPVNETHLLTGSTMIYLYGGVRKTKDLPEREHFRLDNLLGPPMFVDRSPWSFAGVETIGNIPLAEDEVLETHCFAEKRIPMRYWDGEGSRLEAPVEPVGDLVLRNVRSMDLAISRHFGLPEPTAVLNLLSALPEALRIVEQPDEGWVSVVLDVTAPEVIELGEQIHERFDEAYMNGYNWEAVAKRFLERIDSGLLRELELDSGAEMFSASMKHSPENVAKMQTLAVRLGSMIAEADRLIAFIEQDRSEIEWD